MRVPPPQSIHREEDGRRLPLLVWRFAEPVRSVASAPLGGGLGERHWVINASVGAAYRRMDPDVHLAELAHGLGLSGAGVGLLTAVDVGWAVASEDGGVMVSATVGLGHPTWAAAPDGDLRPGTLEGDPRNATPHGDPRNATPHGDPHRRAPGTINVVACVPVNLRDAALVNAVATATEAKAQALWELGVAATGTASDAVCVVCPRGGEAEPYGGPRSTWGARLARAVHRAVAEGARDWPAWRTGVRPGLPA